MKDPWEIESILNELFQLQHLEVMATHQAIAVAIPGRADVAYWGEDNPYEE